MCGFPLVSTITLSYGLLGKGTSALSAASHRNFVLGLSPAQAAGKKQNQQDKQNESKPTSAYHGSAQVKSAATE
jgi:hypothetical protein